MVMPKWDKAKAFKSGFVYFDTQGRQASDWALNRFKPSVHPHTDLSDIKKKNSLQAVCLDFMQQQLRVFSRSVMRSYWSVWQISSHTHNNTHTPKYWLNRHDSVSQRIIICLTCICLPFYEQNPLHPIWSVYQFKASSA